MNENLLEAQEILPDSAEAAEEQAKRRKSGYGRVLITTMLVLLASAAVAALLAFKFLPVLQIYGHSMSPTFADGDIVVTVKTDNIENGDIIAFYVNNKLLVKRVIGVAGDEVHIADNGTVSVNNRMLEEPYVARLHDGAPDVAMPYQVPRGEYFVMGDNREESVDSRHGAVGCVTEEQLVGKLVLRVWPMSGFGFVK